MTMDTDRLVRVYRKIRQARSDLKKEYEQKDDELKAQLGTIETAMLKFLNESNQKTAKTDSGTFYWQEDTMVMGSDWEKFYQFVKDNDAFEAMERRIKKKFVTDYIEENDGDLPPGVSISTKRVIRVRAN